MKRVAVLLIVVLTVTLLPLPLLAQGTSVITGTATGPNGPLANVKVNVLNAQGMVVGTTTTSATGAFRVPNLAPGTYTVQAVSNNTNAVISTTTVTVAAGATATAALTATAAAVAGAAAAGGAGAAAGGAAAAGLSTVAIVGTVAAVAGGIGVVAAVATNGDASASQ